jgi:hypothetical protein
LLFAKLGALTEDFFEDQDLLSVEDPAEGQPPADKGDDEFVKKSLRGGD